MARQAVQDIKAALVRNGAPAYIASGAAPLDANGYHTISMRIKPSSVGGIFTFGTTTGRTNFRLDTWSGVYNLQIREAGGSSAYAYNVKIPHNEWSTLTIRTSRSGEYCKVYVNADLRATVSIAGGIINMSSYKFFAMDQAAGVSYYNGVMSRIRMWNREISVEEVANLANYIDISTDALALDWRMEEGAGATVYDTSGNGNNGTITSATWTSDTPCKARKEVNHNLVPNGDFSHIPPVSVPQTSGNNTWIDGTVGGSSINKVFGLKNGNSNSWAVEFDSTVLTLSGHPTLRIETTGVNSYIQVRTNAIGHHTLPGEGFLLRPSTNYTLTFDMQTEYVSGDSTGANIAILEASHDGTNIGSDASMTQIKTTTGMTRRTITWTTKENTVRGHIEFRIYGHQGTGTLIMKAWFGDVTIKQTTPVTRTVAGARTLAGVRQVA